MINTYQTSIAPPPVPPRLNRSHPILIPAPVQQRSHSKFPTWIFIGVAFLNLVLFVGGFGYLYNKMEKVPAAQAQAAPLSSHKPMARMMVEEPPRSSSQEPTPGYLQWNIKHSFRRNINHLQARWLTILQPGDYYVYSRVTFSRGDPERPLASSVKLKKSERGAEQVVMLAYCNLDNLSSAAAVPRMCTVTQGEVLTLETGDQLSVWVHDLLLVDYTAGVTTFGLHKL